MQKAIGYLQDNPDDIEEVQWIYDLTDEEMELVLRGVS